MHFTYRRKLCMFCYVVWVLLAHLHIYCSRITMRSPAFPACLHPGKKEDVKIAGRLGTFMDPLQYIIPCIIKVVMEVPSLSSLFASWKERGCENSWKAGDLYGPLAVHHSLHN